MILLLVAIAAIALGLAMGGRLEGLHQVSLRGTAPILVLFVAQLLLRQGAANLWSANASAVVYLWCAVSFGLVVLCALNWEVRGMPVVAVGIALNLVVVAVNVGMPVGGSLASSFEMAPSASSIADHGGFYRAVDSETVAAYLGDVVPVPAPRPLRSLLSLGDLLMFLGVGILLEEAVRQARYRPRHAFGSRETPS